MSGSINPRVALIWLVVLGTGPLASTAHAHGENMAVGLALCGGFVQLLSALFLLCVRGKGREKLRAVGTFILVVGVATAILFLAPDDSPLTRVGGWIYALGTFVGPLAGYAWISEHR